MGAWGNAPAARFWGVPHDPHPRTPLILPFGTALSFSHSISAPDAQARTKPLKRVDAELRKNRRPR